MKFQHEYSNQILRSNIWWNKIQLLEVFVWDIYRIHRVTQQYFIKYWFTLIYAVLCIRSRSNLYSYSNQARKVGRFYHFKECTLFNFDCLITWHLGHRCEEKFYLHRKSFWYQKIIVLYRVFGKSKRARTHIKTIKKTASNLDSGITRSTCQRNAEPII